MSICNVLTIFIIENALYIIKYAGRRNIFLCRQVVRSSVIIPVYTGQKCPVVQIFMFVSGDSSAKCWRFGKQRLDICILIERNAFVRPDCDFYRRGCTQVVRRQPYFRHGGWNGNPFFIELTILISSSPINRFYTLFH